MLLYFGQIIIPVHGVYKIIHINSLQNRCSRVGIIFVIHLYTGQPPFAEKKRKKKGVFSGIYLKICYLEQALIVDGLLCKLQHWKHSVRIKKKNLLVLMRFVSAWCVVLAVSRICQLEHAMTQMSGSSSSCFFLQLEEDALTLNSSQMTDRLQFSLLVLSFAQDS